MAEALPLSSSATASVSVKDRLRPRKRKEKADPSSEHPGEETNISKVPRTTTAGSSPGPSNQPHPPDLDDNSQLTCSLRSCSSRLIATSKQSRVEIQISLSDKADLKKLIQSGGVKWNHCGEAVFHDRCWEVVLASARSRAKSNAAGLTPIEKALVKDAAKTSERHSSLEEVKHEAARIAELIRNSKHCVAFTGAGISTSAGIGDYRGKGGKWTEMDRKEVVEKVSKDLRSETLIIRRQSSMLSEDGIAGEGEEEGEGVPYERLRPTYTHEALGKLVELGLLKYIISQNGDGLHLLSGIPEDCLSELHGNVFVECCERCGYRYHRPYYVMDDDASQYYEDLDETGSTDIPKPPHARKCCQCGLCHRTGRRCEHPGCSGYLKDSIINFGDDLEEAILSRAEEHAGKADVMLSLGSTMQVTPACDLVVRNKKAVQLVIINRQETNFDELCYRRDSVSGVGRGSRVFGDCDALMRQLMGCLLFPRQLREWEEGRDERMKHYNTLRTEPA